MRVNIIGSLRKGTGVSQDIAILHGLIAHVYGKDTEIRHIQYTQPHCDQAELAFFIEVINPSLFAYAAKNIWIPNQEWTYQSWKPYGAMVDEIWVKTRLAERLFRDWNPTIRYVSWTSIDKGMPNSKNYRKAIVPTGKNIWRNPKPVVQAYMRLKETEPESWDHLPELHIVRDPTAVHLPAIPANVSSKIIVHDPLTETEYDALLQECGLCICMSAAEGFGHAVNEAMSAGCNLVLSDIPPFRELADVGLWVTKSNSLPHPQCLGDVTDIRVESLVEAIGIYLEMEAKDKEIVSETMRSFYEIRHAKFIANLTYHLTTLQNTPRYSLEALLPNEDELPMVSIITLTRDRRHFMPLARYCFLAQSYPMKKLEWVILDDGKDQIKDLVSDIPNVRYVLIDEPLSIGAKRNLAIESASHDILVMMDDDDIYPNNSVLARVAHMLASPAKSCLFSTVIPCYEINEIKSFMNIPPMTLPMAERVSEATLCFTRAFWEEHKFPDKQIAEGDLFLRGREQECRELSPQDVIVSLIHKKNTTSRKPPKMEQNGCHYGLSDELFTLVSQIDPQH